MLYLLFGILVYAISEFPGTNINIQLMPVYWHMIALGWITQLIMGVSLWMYPKGKSSHPKTGSPYSWLAFGNLNLGLLLRITTEPILQNHREYVLYPYTFSILFQFLGISFYILEIWPRLSTKPMEGKQKP
jgi:hypothetical protein